ncbi:MAG: hypothetical protein GXP03_02085 [Alphaproteobacteria bacterium]|nr:hypothetical protein [Alphaproteobacteria bacterium]
MALAGFAFGGADAVDTDADLSDDYLYEQDLQEQGDLIDPLQAETASNFETLDFERGDTILSFNASTDILELEYTATLGVPAVSVTDFADGTGASIALNGVVVADVAGAQGLDPQSVNLLPV